MDTVTRLRVLEEQLARGPESATLLLALARTWRRLSQPRRALPFAERAIALEPSNPAAWNTLGAIYVDLEGWDEAAQAFRRALRQDPNTPHAEANLAVALSQQAWVLQRAAQQGDWRIYEAQGARLLSLHRARMKQTGQPLVAPFSVLGFHLEPKEQRAAAEAQARRFFSDLEVAGANPSPAAMDRCRDGRRTRIGYLSADFRDNAAGHLLHRLFAAHDRERFEVHALSYGPEDGSDFRRAIRAGVEHFIELRDFDDRTAVTNLRALGLDLVVDLMGFAGNNRAGILAQRVARLQVLWLGYCMTTGAPWIDAFLADRTTVPAALEVAFSEPLIHLPDSYQIYSGQDFPRRRNRAAYGLPEDAMVYACFNMPEKVDPAIWTRWMRILRAVPDSLLWLLAPDNESAQNFRHRTGAAGIAPERVVPAPLLPKRAHLLRVHQADLFLDTPLCNAHTTASDALWAGVPVLTCPGRLFAQRVAASVCLAAGLRETVVSDLESYERLAIALGRDPGHRNHLRATLDAARSTAPLFDVPRFARALEDVFARLVA